MRPIPVTLPDLHVLAASEWRVRATHHRERVDSALGAHLERTRRGIKHPVEDFLFEYYAFRPGQLRRWQPGLGTTLTGPVDELGLSDHVTTTAGLVTDLELLRPRLDGVRWIHRLLSATTDRPASFGCFGLHEWAMVHRADRIRHPQLGLRLSDDDVAGVVEQRGVRCTHIDAYRFFTPTAIPLNDRVLTRADQLRDDQPGCLHVTMDLYKWAGKLSPATTSELIMDCFDLAMDVRWVDMRASPYDLRNLPDPAGVIRTTAPIMIETPDGRAEYVAWQREFRDRAAPLRDRLVAVAGSTLAVLDPDPPSRDGLS